MKEIIDRIIESEEKPARKFTKIVAVNFDGRQYTIRIPKKISNYFEIQRGVKVKFIINTAYTEETGKKIMVVELID